MPAGQHRRHRRALLSAAAAASGLAAAATARAQQPGGPAARRGPLSGKVALVTGAARGIGRATAVELARRGADVALLDIADPDAIPAIGYRLASRAELEEAARLVRAEGARALPLVADLRDLGAMQEAARRAGAELGGGGIDALVCNAAVAVDGPLSKPAPEAWRAVVEVNLTGTVHTVWAAAPLLRRPGGRVVIVTSVQARQGSEGSGAYAATKWAATGLMKSLAAELGAEGIAVNAVAPTAIDTPMLHRGSGRPPPLPADRAQPGPRHGHALPVGTLPAQDIAVAIAFLVGPDAAHISGVTLDVNAGRSAMLTA